ncbi:MAG: sensor histidine kinase [Nitrososphaera sp.]
MRKASWGEKKVRLEYEPHGIVLHADKDRIGQIVSNLVINAAKFTEEGAITVTTSVEEASKTMLLSVQDTGTGIHPDIVPRLFSKFATKSMKGTGLGLFIAKSIAEAHGGTIVASNNEGKGATFTLRLPLQGEMI